MSVLARNRKLSQYEFYTNALKLRKSMRFLLLRDLGIKDKVREVHEFAKDMSEDDRDTNAAVNILRKALEQKQVS